MSQISTHQYMLDEILTSANNNVNPIEYLRDKIKSTYYLKYYIELSVSDKFTSIDINNIQLKQYSYHRSMAGAVLLNKQTVNIVKSVIMNDEAKDSSKILQFKALSEMLFEEESKILKAILTKNLVSIFKNLTHEVLVESLNIG